MNLIGAFEGKPHRVFGLKFDLNQLKILKITLKHVINLDKFYCFLI